MKNRIVLLFLILTFACSEEKAKEIYQGKLEELIVGNFELKKDSLTSDFNGFDVISIERKEFLVYQAINKAFRSIYFFNMETMRIEHQIQIPNEGPDAMKGGGYFLPIEPNKVIAINPLGWIAVYNSSGTKVSEIKSELALPRAIETMVRLEVRKGLMYFNEPYLQIGQNPSHFEKLSKAAGPGEMRSSFPLNFRSWLTRINIETGEVKNSDFEFPEGYSDFQRDLTSTFLLGAYDLKRDRFNLMWPYSDEVYILNDLELHQKIVPRSSVNFNFLPSEIIPWGDNYTVWALPKEASQNIFLLYNKKNDLILKSSKINESGAGETKFERTKHYVLSIYSGDWKPLGEYLFDFESELDLENWFLTSEGLFINKPEQKSEDEYEFYKIDLSRFGN